MAIDFQLFLMATLLFAGVRAVRVLGEHREALGAQSLVVLGMAASLLVFNRQPALDMWGVYFWGSYGMGMVVYWAVRSRRTGWWLAGLVALVGLALAVFYLLLLAFFELRDRLVILGLEETVETYVEPEQVFRKCLEGSEIVALKQKRVVEVQPGVEIWMERQCQGHEEEIEDPQKQQFWFDHKSTAQRLRREAEARLKKDPQIKHVESWIDGDKPYRAKVKYWHKENSEACPLCQYKESEKTPGEWQKKQVRRCLGHRESGSADTHTYEKAKKNQRGQEQLFKRESSIAAFKVYLGQHKSDGKFRLDKEVRHKDGAAGCNQFVTDEVWFIPPKEKADTWASADPGKAQEYEKNGRCRLVWIKNVQKPETRVINGLAVQRDFWERELILDCQLDSKCAEMRREGCELHGEHTAEILREKLAMPESRIKELQDAKAIRG